LRDCNSFNSQFSGNSPQAFHRAGEVIHEAGAGCTPTLWITVGGLSLARGTTGDFFKGDEGMLEMVAMADSRLRRVRLIFIFSF
jgi:hypothetical protein